MRRDSTFSRTAGAVILCLWLTAAPDSTQAQDVDVYTVAKLSVDIQAKDAVTAKKQALRLAKRRALHQLLRRIAPFNSFDSLPTLKDSAVEELLDGFSLRRERNSATRYLATLDFRFQAAAVRKLLTGKRLVISDQQAGRIAVLPVYIENGKINHTGRDPWRMAWNGLDLKHTITPVRLVRAGPSFTMDVLSGLLGGDVEAFAGLRDKYKSQQLVLAVAEPTVDGTTLTTRLFGVDRIGPLSLMRNDPVYKSDVKSTARDAAEITLGILEGRWKLMKSPGGGAKGQAVLTGVDVIVEYVGMKQWLEIRARLVKVPGVQGLDIKSLSARTAQVAFQFPGGAERLSRTLGSHGLALFGGSGAWILRSN